MRIWFSVGAITALLVHATPAEACSGEPPITSCSVQLSCSYSSGAWKIFLMMSLCSFEDLR